MTDPDIVTRLRALAECWSGGTVRDAYTDAADEIERLRTVIDNLTAEVANAREARA